MKAPQSSYDFLAPGAPGRSARGSTNRKRLGAAASTVEAVMYSLRERGIPALAEPDTRRRLSSLDAQQLRAVCTRLRNLKSEIARAWTPEEVEALAVVWRNLK
jgi:transposase